MGQISVTTNILSKIVKFCVVCVTDLLPPLRRNLKLPQSVEEYVAVSWPAIFAVM